MSGNIAEESNKIVIHRRLSNLALHLLFFGIIFVLPEALLRVAIPGRTLDIIWPMYAKSAITIGIFYLNYFIVIPRTLNKPTSRRWEFLVWNTLIIVCGVFLIWLIYNVIYTGPRMHVRRSSSLATFSYILRDAVMLVLAVSLAVALRISRKWLDLEQRHQKLVANRRQSELASLRSQLNPHFLFNILNSIYALIEISPTDAQKAIHHLSSLLRYVVYENPREVLLSHEVEFVTNYVELMRLRMGTRPVELKVDCSADGEIAPLLFVTLVENAFKHGNTSDHTQPIKINISSDGHTVSCTTVNHTDGTNSSTGGGVGLANLRRRIELLYGQNATLTTSLSPTGIYIACLSIKK